MQYKLVIYDSKEDLLLIETYDQEPDFKHIIDTIIEQGGEVGELLCGQGDRYETRSTITVKQ